MLGGWNKGNLQPNPTVRPFDRIVSPRRFYRNCHTVQFSWEI